MAKLRKKAKRQIFLILLFIIILIGFINLNPFSHSTQSNENPSKVEEKGKNSIKTYTAKLIATGDGLIHSPVYNAAYNKTTNTYDFSDMLTYTKEKIKDYDIKYYNQETVFDDSKTYGSYPRFNTPSAFGQNMIDIGFNLVSLATNHSLDFGVSSAKASAAWWEGKKDVLATGMASTEAKSNEHKIMNANGITYTMLSYTYGTNGLGLNDIKKEPFIVNLYKEPTESAINEEYKKKLKQDIAAVRDKVDVLIVAVHWGTEYKQTATEEQRNLAKFLAENDVDIVLGTHSHCIEPWEWIGDTVVFYSFGNFISNQMGAENPLIRKVGTVGMFATLDIVKTVDTEKNTKTIEIKNIGADLNYTYRYYNKDKGKNDYLVIPFSQMESKYLSNYESVYNEFSQVLKTYDNNITIEPLKS